MRVEHLRGDAPIESGEPGPLRFVEPVVSVYDVDVAARPDDPPEARLPAKHRTDRVVLEVIDQGDPRTELRFSNQTVEACRERALRQINVIQFGREVCDQARTRTKGEA